MATTTLILQKSAAKRPADDHAVTLAAAPHQKPTGPKPLPVWPTAGASVAAYRTQAHRLRAEAIAGALKWGWAWLRL